MAGLRQARPGAAALTLPQFRGAGASGTEASLAPPGPLRGSETCHTRPAGAVVVASGGARRRTWAGSSDSVSDGGACGPAAEGRGSRAARSGGRGASVGGADVTWGLPRVRRAIPCRARPAVEALQTGAGGHARVQPCSMRGSPPPSPQGCKRREGASEAAPAAVKEAVGGGCQSGSGRLLSGTSAVNAGSRR